MVEGCKVTSFQIFKPFHLGFSRSSSPLQDQDDNDSPDKQTISFPSFRFGLHALKRASMEGVRQSLDKLRTEVDKGISRRREADSRSKILATQLKEKDEELYALRQRLDLARQFLTLATKWEETRRILHEHAEKIALANAKAEQFSNMLSRVELERDAFEARYLDVQANAKALDAQLNDLL